MKKHLKVDKKNSRRRKKIAKIKMSFLISLARKVRVAIKANSNSRKEATVFSY